MLDFVIKWDNANRKPYKTWEPIAMGGRTGLLAPAFRA